MIHALLIAATIAARASVGGGIKWCLNEPYPVGSGFLIRGKRTPYTLAETDNEVMRVDKVIKTPLNGLREPEILGYVFVIGNGQKNFSSTLLAQVSTNDWNIITRFLIDSGYSKPDQRKFLETTARNTGQFTIPYRYSKAALDANHLALSTCRPRFSAPLNHNYPY